MAKEFDIFLNNRLTQCDIIVYSIPFRDGLTAAHRMILESCLESYVLQKFVAVQTNSELVSHIDKMIKVCIERLNWGTSLDVSADFQTHYVLNPTPSVIEIAPTNNLETLRTMFTSVDNALDIAVAPLNAMIAKSLGGGNSVMNPNVNVRDVLKRSILQPISNMEITSQVSDMQVQKTLSAESVFIPTADLVNLCYRLYTASETVMQLAASVLETEIHFSLGGGNAGFEITSELSEEYATKYEVAKNVVSILAQAVEWIIQYMEPESNGVQFAAEVTTVLKRHRMLEEMDEDTLLSYDDMTLEEVDYIIL